LSDFTDCPRCPLKPADKTNVKEYGAQAGRQCERRESERAREGDRKEEEVDRSPNIEQTDNCKVEQTFYGVSWDHLKKMVIKRKREKERGGREKEEVKDWKR